MSTCLIPNCRKPAVLDFCAEHREPSDEISRLRRTLEFYANPAIYSMPVQDMKRHAFQDRGQRARTALGKTAHHG